MTTYQENYKDVANYFKKRGMETNERPLDLGQVTKPQNPTVLAVVVFMLQYNNSVNKELSTKWLRNTNIKSFTRAQVDSFNPFIEYMTKDDKDENVKLMYQELFVLYLLLIQKKLKSYT